MRRRNNMRAYTSGSTLVPRFVVGISYAEDAVDACHRRRGPQPTKDMHAEARKSACLGPGTIRRTQYPTAYKVCPLFSQWLYCNARRRRWRMF